MPSPQLLDHRSIVSVSGADAEPFLNGLLTVSTIGIQPNENRYGALLTPQGKVIADMLVTREGDAILVDCAASVAPALLKRLSMFKLRARIGFAIERDCAKIGTFLDRNERAPEAPHRRIAPRASAPAGDPAQYHAARIAAGLPEQDVDFGAEEVFPAEINMDLFDGVDFRKGCFVGQEVVSRMKRRGTARRRTLRATVPAGITAPSPILAISTSGGFEIGTLTSVSGSTALARIRIDRVAEARTRNETIIVDGHAIQLDAPPWLADELAAIAEAKEARA
jgi:folate-binding protein YgfZ